MTNKVSDCCGVGLLREEDHLFYDDLHSWERKECKNLICAKCYKSANPITEKEYKQKKEKQFK